VSEPILCSSWILLRHLFDMSAERAFDLSVSGRWNYVVRYSDVYMRRNPVPSQFKGWDCFNWRMEARRQDFQELLDLGLVELITCRAVSCMPNPCRLTAKGLCEAVSTRDVQRSEEHERFLRWVEGKEND
jgi:hypothetical protein